MWPPEALEFLRDLEDNNESEWFRANRKRYDDYLVTPARELADKLSDLGNPHFFRPYNNLRFRPGPPLKEHLGVAIGYGAAGGFYFDLSLDGFLVAAGLWHPAPDQLERFRAAIDDDRRARGFERGLAAAQRGGLTPAEPELKRAPRGYPNDHPRVHRLRMKQLTVSSRHPLEPWLHQPSCDERVRTEMLAARPLVKWLADTVGPSMRGRG
ncbi:MAG TPA: DUF2461 domain-containing protein [Solirubrobacteraceae bacterium]|nr:DUF2461 domain-containing protein [Solirubrobacteraceae bacterium]